jgi:hypothetical protein
MTIQTEPIQLKTVGQSGQISLGKAYIGKTLQMTTQPDGTIVLTPVAIVPESQMWTLQEPARSAIARGMAHAAAIAPSETDLETLLARAGHGR